MKRVVVTGGNKGIGKAICKKLLEEYPDVHVILCSRDRRRGEQAVADLQKEIGANACEGRLELVEMDTSSDESVEKAGKTISSIGTPIYGIVNNAAVGPYQQLDSTINTNYFGVRRVNRVLGDMLQRPGGRIVNMASASGPFFVSECPPGPFKDKMAEPWKISGGFEELDDIARKTNAKDAYGLSKALLNAYTWLLSRSEPELVVNSCTPGFIDTDMTKSQGATNPPSKGAVPPVWLLMSENLLKVPTGRYYGSDCKRSPMHVYRGPGDPEYTGPDGP